MSRCFGLRLMIFSTRMWTGSRSASIRTKEPIGPPPRDPRQRRPQPPGAAARDLAALGPQDSPGTRGRRLPEIPHGTSSSSCPVATGLSWKSTEPATTQPLTVVQTRLRARTACARIGNSSLAGMRCSASARQNSRTASGRTPSRKSSSRSSSAVSASVSVSADRTQVTPCVVMNAADYHEGCRGHSRRGPVLPSVSRCSRDANTPGERRGSGSRHMTSFSVR